MLNAEFVASAVLEIDHARAWYLKRSVKAAEGFKERVRLAVEAACTKPLSAGFLVGKRARKILLKPYSYGMIYFAHGGKVYVIAIAHNRQRPGYWKKRLMRD